MSKPGRTPLVGRAESGLLLLFAAGLALVAQPWWQEGYRVGLVAVAASTLLNIAVGNVPPALTPGPALLRALLLLLILGAVFGIGYLLVPSLAGLGQ